MKSILDLAADVGLEPVKTATTLGGEWHSPCPACQGNDRLCIWPNNGKNGRYWCRKCDIKGDSIQFCRDYLGASFKEAVELTSGYIHNYSPEPVRKHSRHETVTAPPQKKPWIEKAEEFVETSHKRLMMDSESLSLVKERGLSEESIRTYRIGWNPITSFQFRSAWGLSEDSEKKKLCIPRGIVIPTYGVVNSSTLTKLKVRRADYNEGDKWPKYYEIPGSSKALSVYGFRSAQTAILVESEFDAMTIVQESSSFFSSVALGGAQKKPDKETFNWLTGRKLVLYSLDCDDAGRAQYEFWRSMFHNLRAWQSDSHKSPADSFLKGGVDLMSWCLAGVEHWKTHGYDALKGI